MSKTCCHCIEKRGTLYFLLAALHFVLLFKIFALFGTDSGSRKLFFLSTCLQNNFFTNYLKQIWLAWWESIRLHTIEETGAKREKTHVGPWRG